MIWTICSLGSRRASTSWPTDLLGDALDEVVGDVEVDVGFEQGRADLRAGLPDVGLGDPAAAAQLLERVAQTALYAFEHATPDGIATANVRCDSSSSAWASRRVRPRRSDRRRPRPRRARVGRRSTPGAQGGEPQSRFQRDGGDRRATNAARTEKKRPARSARKRQVRALTIKDTTAGVARASQSSNGKSHRDRGLTGVSRIPAVAGKANMTMSTATAEKPAEKRPPSERRR